MDHVSEVTFPEGVLRVEVDSTEVDGAGRINAYLNGKQISKERAEEIVGKARRRAAVLWKCESCGTTLTWAPPVEGNPGMQKCPRCDKWMERQ